MRFRLVHKTNTAANAVFHVLREEHGRRQHQRRALVRSRFEKALERVRSGIRQGNPALSSALCHR